MSPLASFKLILDLFFITLFLALSSLTVQGATYYVDDDNCPNYGTGMQADPFCSIQSAIDAGWQNPAEEDKVLVAAGTYGGFEMRIRIEIVGAGQNVSIIQGTVYANGVDSTAKLDGFTITASGSGSSTGMYIYQAAPVVTNCTFSNHTNTLGDGGGMRIYDFSAPTIANCRFSNNTARNGGGVYFVGVNALATFSNCTFDENTATYFGGGMYAGGSVTVSNSTFYKNSILVMNSTSYGGGGIYNYGYLTITDSDFFENLAPNGGGIYNLSSGLTVRKSKFTGNSAKYSGGGIYNGAYSALTDCLFALN